MHSTKIKGTTFIHNGDFSGDIEIVSGSKRVEVPFEDIKQIVAEQRRNLIVDYVEQASAEQIFELYNVVVSKIRRPEPGIRA